LLIRLPKSGSEGRLMQRVIGNYWIPTVVIAMAMTLAGCGGSDAPSASSATSWL
jgi:hypothetical protein